MTTHIFGRTFEFRTLLERAETRAIHPGRQGEDRDCFADVTGEELLSRGPSGIYAKLAVATNDEDWSYLYVMVPPDVNHLLLGGQVIGQTLQSNATVLMQFYPEECTRVGREISELVTATWQGQIGSLI